jgi:hypothetical protein
MTAIFVKKQCWQSPFCAELPKPLFALPIMCTFHSIFWHLSSILEPMEPRPMKVTQVY